MKMIKVINNIYYIDKTNYDEFYINNLLSANFNKYVTIDKSYVDLLFDRYVLVNFDSKTIIFNNIYSIKKIEVSFDQFKILNENFDYFIYSIQDDFTNIDGISKLKEEVSTINSNNFEHFYNMYKIHLSEIENINEYKKYLRSMYLN